MISKSFNRIKIHLTQDVRHECKTIVLCCLEDEVGFLLSKYKFNFHSEIQEERFYVEPNLSLIYVKSDQNPYKSGSKIAEQLQKHKLKEQVCIITAFSDPDKLKLIEACILRYPEFIQYKTKSLPEDMSIFLVVDGLDACNHRLNQILTITDSVLEARRLINTAPNHMRPSDFVEEAKKLTELGVKCTVLEGKEIDRMECLKAVGIGSEDKSKLILLELIQNKDKPIIALVGKGVTFDSGGYSIKPPKSMEQMHSDMSGAACVYGTMMAAAKLNLDVNLVCAIPCAENMISGSAMRVEDVYTSYSGQTVHILNTDAEGRLILADAMSYVQEKYNPSIMLDFATLTGAIVVALGDVFAGVYANDDSLFQNVNRASEDTFERIWRMPLAKEYSEMMQDKNTDLKNVSDGYGAGSATAAAFLSSFVKEKVKWCHFDIAGVAFLSKSTVFSSHGATGFGIRLALDILNDLL